MDLELPPFDPPSWATTGHTQTILAHLLPSAKPPTTSGTRWRIPLADGDVLIGTFYEGSSPFLVILFHGLTGSCQSDYMGRSTLVAQKQNHSVLTVNHRGCGFGAGLARHPYHSGRGDDISEVIGFCRTRLPQKKIIAIGFSLSANALLTLLCGIAGENQPDLAIAVNGPTDLAACAEELKKGLNRIYDFRFVRACRDDIYKKRDLGLIEFKQKIPYLSHLHDIDKLYTAPYSGFRTADNYYASCSTFPYFSKIKTPTVILMSQDDPFIPWQPYLNAKNNPAVHLHFEKTGGHLGYLTRGETPFSYRRWLDEALDRILAHAPSFC